MNAKELGDSPASLTIILTGSVDVAEIKKAFTESRVMTKRELFAAMAMHAIISKHKAETVDRNRMDVEYEIAKGAVDYADALLAEIAKADAS